MELCATFTIFPEKSATGDCWIKTSKLHVWTDLWLIKKNEKLESKQYKFVLVAQTQTKNIEQK